MKQNNSLPTIDEKEAVDKNEKLEIFQKRPIDLKHLNYSNLKLSIQCFADSRRGTEKCKCFIESVIHKSNSVIAEEIAFTESFLADSYSIIFENNVDTMSVMNNDTTTSSTPTSSKEKRAAKAAKEAEIQKNAAIHKANARYLEALSFINSADLILQERLESIKATTNAFIENYLRKVNIKVPNVEIKFDETPWELYKKVHTKEREVNRNEER